MTDQSNDETHETDPSENGPSTTVHSAPSDDMALPQSLRDNWLAAVFLGVALVVGGILAVAMPVAAGMGATVVIGVVVLVAGLIQAFHAFRCHGWRARGLHALSAAVYIFGGLFLSLNPLSGTVALSLIVVAVLIVDGALRVMLGLRMRPTKGWGWLAGGGAVSAAFGLLIVFVALPQASLTLLGVLAGVSLIVEGVSFLVVALALSPRTNGGMVPS